MKSYVRGPSLALIEKTIDEVFRETVARGPGQEALVSRHQGIRLTWAELEDQVSRTAAGLWGLGLRPGDRVGMWASSCAEWFFLQLATARVGAVLVNVNPAYRADDLRFILQRSGMKALFLNEKDARADYGEILDKARAGTKLPLEHAIFLGASSWDDMIAAGTEPGAPPKNPNEVANIQYTSGTTGKPKGVMLTHRNLLNNAYVVGRAIDWSAADRLCLAVPMYHCFGCVMGSMACVIFGATLVMPSAVFNAAPVLEAIDEERCTTIYGVPTMFIAELEHPDFARRDMSSLRTGIMAGAPCPIELMKRVVDDMHCSEMTIAYGLTEASPVITQSSTTDSVEVRVSTVGRVMPETEAKIIDRDSGETVDVGTQGELCTRGYLVMKGYDQDPEATARVLDSDGWLRTGDLATMREDGNFRITGRLKEMIIRGGENIYPREIEEFLHEHPKVADVYVVGLPDERLGESVLAWIRLLPGETATQEEIRDYCRGRIAHFKIPRNIRFVDEFPMTVTGKVQKFVIRRKEMEMRSS
jgi:fatty-acyl-CoA synthase